MDALRTRALQVAETVLASAGQTAAALAGELRYVTSNPTRPAFTRRCFLDWKVEARGRFTNGPRRVEIYTAVERRNDIQLLFEQARTRLLLGLRFGLAEASPAPGFPR